MEPFRILIDPSGKFAYVDDEGGAVSIYTINSDGTLKDTGLAEATIFPLSLAITGNAH